MRVRRMLIVAVAVIWPGAAATSRCEAGRVQLELVGQAPGASLAFQQWLRVLSQAGVRNVRIRSGQAADKVGVDVRGTRDDPLYVVTGIVKSQDELIMPGGRYRRGDAARLARWLADLARHGPQEQRPQEAAFGLSVQQFEEILKDTSRPVAFSTEGMPRRQAVERIGRGLLLPLRLDAQTLESIGREEVEEELSGLSSGTALACLLRPMGFCLVPRRLGRTPGYAVVRSRPGTEVWPIGWEPEKPLPEVLPAMFEFHNVAVGGVPASLAIEAIGKRLKVPVLMDHNALARHGIDPTKILVAHPRKRTTYGVALRQILNQARLKSEVRVDEGGRPFLWISTLRPM